MSDVATVCAELRVLQRQRVMVLGSRNMQSNRLLALVAGTLGYSPALPDKDRRKKFAEAAALVAAVEGGKSDSPLKDVILTTMLSVGAFDRMCASFEKAMEKWVAKLPVAAWAAPNTPRRGFGLLSLAKVVGEAGDLAGYANPAKLWRRMGCAPWEFKGETLMGATWGARKKSKSLTKLTDQEWVAYGYSPRRRSVAYLIGANLVRMNYLAGEVAAVTEGAVAGEGGAETEGLIAGDDASETESVGAGDSACEIDRGNAGDGQSETESASAGDNGSVTDPTPAGPYRSRYLEAKAKAAVSHPDWPKTRLHLHGMLLATKMLLKDLWVEWNGKDKAHVWVAA